MFALTIILVFASWHDIRFRRIPNYLTYSGLVIVFAFAIQTDYLPFPGVTTDSNEYLVSQTALGCIGLTIPLLLLHSCGGIGGGDVKLGACIGAFAGLENGITILITGHILAGTVALLFGVFGFVACHSTHVEDLSGVKTQFSSFCSTGMPMACFYLIGTLVAGSSL